MIKRPLLSAFDEHQANDFRGALDITAAHVQMGNRADRLRTDGVHPDALVFQLGHHAGGGAQARIDVEDDDVGVDFSGRNWNFGHERTASARILAWA